MGKVISVSEVSKLTGVTIKTLKIWDENGALKSKYRTAGGHRRYDLDEVNRFIGETADGQSSPDQKAFIYCCVSTRKQAQSGNLQRQKDRLIQYCIDHQYQIGGIFEEIASGLNDHRRELIKLFRRLNEVDRIIIEYPDRLARFGYTYLKEFAGAFDVTIEVVEKSDHLQPNEELVNDLVGMVTCFSARIYGARGGRKAGKHLEQAFNELEGAEKNEDNDSGKTDQPEA